MMLQTVQELKGSLGRDVMLQTARLMGVGGERLDVTDSASGIAVGGERRDVTDSARGKGSVRRDVILQTVEGGSCRWGET